MTTPRLGCSAACTAWPLTGNIIQAVQYNTTHVCSLTHDDTETEVLCCLYSLATHRYNTTHVGCLTHDDTETEVLCCLYSLATHR
ncbi:hypothetical protein J6590_055897 [Homalodisca vitripennis]|nr:hypothetical protein J6590_055897 [Homalodisca vitripennis]